MRWSRRAKGGGGRLTTEMVEVLDGVAQAHDAGDNVDDGPEPVRVDEVSLVRLEPAHLHDRHLALEGLQVGRVHLPCARRWEQQNIRSLHLRSDRRVARDARPSPSVRTQGPSASRSVLEARVWKKPADRAPPAALAAPAAQPALGEPPRPLNSLGRGCPHLCAGALRGVTDRPARRCSKKSFFFFLRCSRSK